MRLRFNGESLSLSLNALEGFIIGLLAYKPTGFGIALYPKICLGVVSLRTTGNGAFAMVIAGWRVLCHAGYLDNGLTIRNFSIILSTVDVFVKLILSVNLLIGGPMIGERLKQARLGAGLSMDALVTKMDHFLTKQAISKYETGKSVPGSEVLVRLADALGVKTGYFMQEPKVKVEFIAYRKHSRLPKAEANRLQVQITDHLEHYCWLATLFPAGGRLERRAAAGIPKPRQAKSADDAEKIAKELREDWKIGLDPIENLAETLEDHAAAVLALDADERFDGHSAWATVFGDDERTIPVLVTNSAMSGDRQRFNLAHELGHLAIKQKQTKEDEDIAHRFAAAFLVPDEAAYKELGRSRSRIEFDELLLLKHKYGLSMQAWLRRAKDLGIITPSWYKNTVVIFRKRKWHKREPGKQVAPEQPLRFKQLVLRAMAEGIISRERAEELNPGVVSLNGKEGEMTKAKKIAALSLDERRKLLEAAAERAAHEYETDKELTAFTELDGAVND